LSEDCLLRENEPLQPILKCLSLGSSVSIQILNSFTSASIIPGHRPIYTKNLFLWQFQEGSANWERSNKEAGESSPASNLGVNTSKWDCNLFCYLFLPEIAEATIQLFIPDFER